jgi:threonine synthase
LEIVDGIKLLARTEGIFTETAGGVTVATARRLAAQGRLDRKGATVLVITGNGLKTPDAIEGALEDGVLIDARLAEVAALVQGEPATVAA